MQITLEAESPYYAPRLAQASPKWLSTGGTARHRFIAFAMTDASWGQNLSIRFGESCAGRRVSSVASTSWDLHHCQLHPIMRGVLVVTDDESHEQASSRSFGEMVSNVESPKFFVDSHDKER